MDYCSACRRHLNGALVCPGCGAYAPDIAPPGSAGYSGPSAVPAGAAPAATGWESMAADPWPERSAAAGP
ncbi:SCO2400 family protein [Streptomyces sp. NPDC004561]